MNLKTIGKVPTSKSVGTGPSSYEKIIYLAAVSQRSRNTAIEDLLKAAVASVSCACKPHEYYCSEEACTSRISFASATRRYFCNITCCFVLV